MLDPDFFLRCLAPAGAIAIGAAIGSFLNVCIYRIPIGLTVTKPKRSFCPSCRAQIKAIDNIPVISWLLLKGRCRSCLAPIPIWYFLGELFAAIGSGIACLKSGLPGAAIFLIVYSFLTYALRTARAGYSSRPGFLVLLLGAAGLLYFKTGEVRWEDLWKLGLCCLGAILILGSGYARSFGKWNRWSRSAVIFSAALAGGWLGSLAAATMFISIQKRSPDTEDAILLACVSVGPLFL
jgi:prepilin signal peptidase PulO-like enzyme (type II secretory pathway)